MKDAKKYIDSITCMMVQRCSDVEQGPADS